MLRIYRIQLAKHAFYSKPYFVTAFNQQEALAQASLNVSSADTIDVDSLNEDDFDKLQQSDEWTYLDRSEQNAKNVFLNIRGLIIDEGPIEDSVDYMTDYEIYINSLLDFPILIGDFFQAKFVNNHYDDFIERRDRILEKVKRFGAIIKDKLFFIRSDVEFLYEMANDFIENKDTLKYFIPRLKKLLVLASPRYFIVHVLEEEQRI